MKVMIIIVITVLLVACSTTQNFKQDSQSDTILYNSDQNKEYKFAGSIGEEEPFPIKKARLKYPRIAKNNKIEGTVILQVEVFADGTVGSIEVIKSLMSGPDGLDEAAVNSVKKWKFSPAKKNGKPVTCLTTFAVGFRL